MGHGERLWLILLCAWCLNGPGVASDEFSLRISPANGTVITESGMTWVTIEPTGPIQEGMMLCYRVYAVFHRHTVADGCEDPRPIRIEVQVNGSDFPVVNTPSSMDSFKIKASILDADGEPVAVAMGWFDSDPDPLPPHERAMIKYMFDGIGSVSTQCFGMSILGICLQLGAKTLLELGTARDGLTTQPLAYAAYRTRGHLTSVDILPQSFEQPAWIEPHWTYRTSDALAFLRELPDDKVFDVVYIDDLHEYYHVRQEIALLESHITPSSVILMHDAMQGDAGPHYPTPLQHNGSIGGVYAALVELDMAKWEFSTLPNCLGLTILRRKADKYFEHGDMEYLVEPWARKSGPGR